jgi:threonine aldolase
METETAVVDLRSDTVTRPGPGMRQAIAEAVVGDDVFGDDPTVLALQEKVAGILGKEAALFVPSGTMSNGIAVKVHTRPGDEMIVESGCHMFNFETGSAAVISGVQVNSLPGVRGVITAGQVEAAVRPIDDHFARSRLVCVENSCNVAGGTLFPLEEMERIREVARRHGLRMHLDGARLWNASVAEGIEPARYAAQFDTVSVCLSKGLGAPVGSLLAGSAELVLEAHRVRKMLGGGMRQAGVLAAAGLYAIEHHWQRMAEDHRLARMLAETLHRLPGVEVDLEAVRTNIVMGRLCREGWTTERFTEELEAQGVRITRFGADRFRLVTHLDVQEEAAQRAASVFELLLG